MREERLSILNKEAESINPVDQKYIDSFNSLYQQETEIKQKEFELRSIEKDIADKQRELEALQSNIGWQEVFYDTDSTEAMKSHMSDLVLGKQEQIAYINQLERGLEENKIERNSNSNEINQVENELVPDETFEKKKEYTQQVLELHEKENLYEKLKETLKKNKHKNKRQKFLRIGFIVLTILSAALSIFLFHCKSYFWYNICSINCDFCSRYHFSRSKAVDYSTAISQEINDLENQLTQLEKNIILTSI